MCDFSGETFKGFEVLSFPMSATTTQLLSSGEFCKLRYDTVPVKSASSNVSVYTNNSKMPNIELWHSCRKWAKWFVLMTGTDCVLCEVRSESLRIGKFRCSKRWSLTLISVNLVNCTNKIIVLAWHDKFFRLHVYIQSNYISN